MKAIIAILALVSATALSGWISGLWRQSPVHLACSGELNHNAISETKTLDVAINFQSGEVDVAGFQTPFRITDDGGLIIGRNGIFFTDRVDGPNSGRLDRFTGIILVLESQQLSDGVFVQKFEGRCRQTERLW